MSLDDIRAEHIRVLQALFALRYENPIWNTNYNKFLKMGLDQRTWWWAAFKKQAVAGALAPRLLLSKVIEMRLTT